MASGADWPTAPGAVGKHRHARCWLHGLHCIAIQQNYTSTWPSLHMPSTMPATCPRPAARSAPIQPRGNDQELQAADEDVVQAHAVPGGLNVVCVDEDDKEE